MNIITFFAWTFTAAAAVAVFSSIFRVAYVLFFDFDQCWICDQRVYFFQSCSVVSRGPFNLYRVDGAIRSASVSGTGLVHDRCRRDIVVYDISEFKTGKQ